MNIIEVIRPDGDLRREVWRFSLSVSYASPCIYFDGYSFQTKETTRHKNWIKQTHWERLDKRNNNIGEPSIPQDVETEMRTRYQQTILTLPIMR